MLEDLLRAAERLKQLGVDLSGLAEQDIYFDGAWQFDLAGPLLRPSKASKSSLHTVICFFFRAIFGSWPRLQQGKEFDFIEFLGSFN
jgi:hypothetical protein